MRPFSLVSFLLLSLSPAAIAACTGASSDDSSDSRGSAATVGIPNTPVLGYWKGSAFEFTDPVTKQPFSRSFRYASDGDGIEILNPDASVGGAAGSALLGPKLTEFDSTNGGLSYGYVTAPENLWDCDAAERFALGDNFAALGRPTRANGGAPKCHIEITATGTDARGTSVGVLIVGLDAAGKGFAGFVGGGGAAPAAVNGGAPQPISSGPPRRVNVTLDDAAMVNAMVAATKEFRTDEGERQTCLKNARAGRWLDIQAHFYCILPLDERTCYSNKLVEAVTAFPDEKQAVERAKAIAAGYDACFNSASPTVTAAARAIHKSYEAPFKYVMFTVQGKSDFNLESEQKAINAYYSALGIARPRRQVDTFPAWAPAQPRYEAIRQRQVEAQKLETQ